MPNMQQAIIQTSAALHFPYKYASMHQKVYFTS